MKKVVVIICLLFAIQSGLMAQSSFSPSASINMIQINGYRYPAPSFSNIIWLSLVPEQAFINELQLFDYHSFELHGESCTYFSSEHKLPNAEYIIQKCEGGELDFYWFCEANRQDKISIADLLQKDLRYYPSVKEGEMITTYKIKYQKWYVFISIKRENDKETISVRNSRNPY